jgi:hypothetical protein
LSHIDKSKNNLTYKQINSQVWLNLHQLIIDLTIKLKQT